jgi:hypothetical protein
MQAGARIRPPGEKVKLDDAREAELRYETFVCDEDGVRGVHSAAEVDVMFASAKAIALAAGAAGRSELRAPKRYAADPDPIVLAGAGEVLPVSKVSVAAVAGAEAATYTHAAETALAGDLQLARLGVG